MSTMVIFGGHVSGKGTNAKHGLRIKSLTILIVKDTMSAYSLQAVSVHWGYSISSIRTADHKPSTMEYCI